MAISPKTAPLVDNHISKDQLAEKDRLIDKLYSDVKDMHLKLECVASERNEAIEKFSESEKYWR